MRTLGSKRLIPVFALALWGLNPITLSALDAATLTLRHFLVAQPLLYHKGPTMCPAEASASSGDVVELSGAGSFVNSTLAKVAGMGSYLVKDSAGNYKDSGIWAAKSLVSFQSYGTQSGSMPLSEGGIAMIGVNLSSDNGGVPIAATLTVNCNLGSLPPGFSADFVNLDVTGGENFDIRGQAGTVFLPRP